MAPRAVGRPPGPLRGVLGVSEMGLPRKAAPLGLLGERLVSEAARLPRDTCGAWCASLA